MERDGVRGSIDASVVYALLFGLFLGLAILKFGNPVILDQKIDPPTSLAEAWVNAWPTHWGNWILLPLALAGGALALTRPRRWTGNRWLWLLPLMWFGWQLVSATQSVDSQLTATTLWQFFGCVVAYFIGALVLGNQRAFAWLLIGVLAGFAFCLVRAVDQRLIEFPQTRQMLLDGERTGWTNVPPDMLAEMRHDHAIITTNGVEVANPAMLAKFTNGRVMGTLVYPNALAGAVLLLWPVSLALAFGCARQLRPSIRVTVIAVTGLLGAAGLFWSGSKAGWLIALALAVAWLSRLKWPARLKWVALTVILLAGLALFAVRFQSYFAAGATSVGARFNCWRAAVQITREHVMFGTGPGTFQRPYARLKPLDAEMARLTHNDYLEQFSDSGVIAGISYAAWIGLALVAIGRRVWRDADPVQTALFLGLLGWFAQGMVEFSLYVPALAWTAFTLLGSLLALSGNRVDKRPAAG